MNSKQESEKHQPERKNPIISAILGPLCAACKRITSKNPNNEEASDPEHEIAKWTRVVANWTRGLVAVGVITAAILFLQLCTLEKTDQTLNRQIDTQIGLQRAYMLFGSIRADDLQQFFSVKLVLKNYGTTPAILQYFAAKPIPIGKLPAIPDYGKAEHTVTTAPIPFGGEFSREIPIFLTETEIGKIQAGDLTLWLPWKIEYRDIFFRDERISAAVWVYDAKTRIWQSASGLDTPGTYWIVK